MKNLSIFLLFISGLSYGQSNTYPDGHSATTLSNYYGGIKVNTFFQMPRKFSDFVGSDSTGMIWFDSALTKTVMYNDGYGKQTLTSKRYVDSISAASIGGVSQTTLNDSCAAIRASISGADSSIYVTVTRQKDSLLHYLPTWLFALDTVAQRNYSNSLYQPIGNYALTNDSSANGKFMPYWGFYQLWNTLGSNAFNSTIFIPYSDTPSKIYSRYDVDTAKVRITSSIPSLVGYMRYVDTPNLIPTKFDIDTFRNRINATYQPIGTYLHPSDTISLSNRLADSIALVVHKKDSLIAGGYVPYSTVNPTSQAGKYLGSIGGVFGWYTPPTVVGSLSDLDGTIVLNPAGGVGAVVDISLNQASNFKFTGNDTFTKKTTFQADISAAGHNATADTFKGKVSQANVYPAPTTGTVTSVGTTYPLTGGAITTTGSVAMPKATIHVAGYIDSTDFQTFNNKGSGSVTSVAAGTNLLGGTITTTGTLTPDTSAGHLATKTDLLAKINYSDTPSLIPTKFDVDTAKARLTTAINTKGTGTVTSASVVSANGFAGTVATSTTTPAFTLSTTINSPILAGNGTSISAATTTGSGSTAVLSTHPTVSSPIASDSVMILANGVSAMTGLVNCLEDNEGTKNNYLQVNLRNQSNGTGASGDYVVTADNGTETTHYVDIGMNGSGFSAAGTWTINGADGAYVYSTDSLAIGTSNNKPVMIFTGGTLAANNRLTIDSAGNTFFKGMTSQYGLFYGSTTDGKLTQVPIGTANQVLAVNSGANGYTWTAAGGGGATTTLVAGYGIALITGTNVYTVSVSSPTSYTVTAVHANTITATSGQSCVVILDTVNAFDTFAFAGFTNTPQGGGGANNKITIYFYNQQSVHAPAAVYLKGANFAIAYNAGRQPFCGNTVATPALILQMYYADWLGKSIIDFGSNYITPP